MPTIPELIAARNSSQAAYDALRAAPFTNYNAIAAGIAALDTADKALLVALGDLPV